MGRQSIIDQTTTIDDANLSKIQGLTEIAMQELNTFDTAIDNDVAEKYEKIKSEMLSDSHAQTQTVPTAVKFEKVENEFFPTINLRQDEAQEEVAQPTISINLRGKLIIGVFASIVLLLSILLIYNAVLINRYKAEIGADSQTVISLEAENAALESQLQGLMGATTPESLGMSQGVAQDIELIQRTPVAELEQDTNWFDAICNFFSELFGG
jgi:cell division protein FtsL